MGFAGRVAASFKKAQPMRRSERRRLKNQVTKVHARLVRGARDREARVRRLLLEALANVLQRVQERAL
ncbi:MAG TPA: hypothetical protein VFF73_14430 [Planctomycetota bacterium]|nr:hypothetical protein [Planctomycetota bacterium]